MDCVFTDPPYDSQEKHRKIGTTTRLKTCWYSTIKDDDHLLLMSEFLRILKSGRHLYVMCDKESVFSLHRAGVDAGFKYWNTLVWDKVFMGMGYHYRRVHEFILFFEKVPGKRRLKELGVTDIIRSARIPYTQRLWPSEKPVILVKTCLENSTNRGESVCDPFVGSGSTAVACQELGLNFLGCDIDPEAVAVVKSRFRL